MGKKQQNAQKMRKRFCEALRLVQDSEAEDARIEQTRLLNLREVLDRENVSVAAFDELRDRRGNVVLRGDGRSVVLRGDGRIVRRGDPLIPYIPYLIPDLLHLQMRVLSAQYPCVWCAQPAAEQE
jgi:hypothetical protein